MYIYSIYKVKKKTLKVNLKKTIKIVQEIENTNIVYHFYL